MSAHDVCGLYVDQKMCAIFVVPMAWDERKSKLRVKIHGAFPEGHELADWYAHGTFDVQDLTCTMHRQGEAFTGRFKPKMVVWTGNKTRHGGTWTKVHLLNVQVSALQRPLYMSMMLFRAVRLMIVLLVGMLRSVVASAKCLFRPR